MEDLQLLANRRGARDLWVPFDDAGREGLAMSYPRAATGSGNITPTSGTPIWVGGCILEAGDIVEAATFVPGGLAEGQTHLFFTLGIPDEAGADEAAVAATTKDELAVIPEANVAKTLSFKSADGGSGGFQAMERMPILAGFLQVAPTKTSTLRGIAGSGQINAAGKGFMAAATSAGGVTTPGSLASVVALSALAGIPWCFLSGRRAS